MANGCEFDADCRIRPASHLLGCTCPTRLPYRIELLPLKVLIVEDNPAARVTLEKILSLEGFYVQSAGTLRRGKELLDGQAAIILDLNLPDGNGVDLLRQIRAENRSMKVLEHLRATN